MIQAEIIAYELADGSKLERCKQSGKPTLYKWAIRRNGDCMNNLGEWEYEPQPSSRDDGFFARCRFDSAESAYELWVKSK